MGLAGLGVWEENRLGVRRCVVIRLRSAALLVACGILVGACQSDSVYEDLDLDESHFGMKAQVEPGEPFEIGLLGNGAYPDAEWAIVEVDTELVQLQGIEVIPARPEGAWLGEYEGPFLPVTIHRFTAGAFGESLLALEVQADGQTVDRYEVTISVVEDACSLPEESSLILAANRC